MNATSQIWAGSMPKLFTVRPMGKLCIEVTWSGGPRAHRTETIDLAPLIHSHKFYKPLRRDPALFQTVHLIDEGEVIAWGADDAIDMPATSVERLAQDMMTPRELRIFIYDMNYTHNMAAAQLGYSRRQIENFLAGTKPIPRVCVLACYALRYQHAQKTMRGVFLTSGTTASVSHSGVSRNLFNDCPYRTELSATLPVTSAVTMLTHHGSWTSDHDHQPEKLAAIYYAP